MKKIITILFFVITSATVFAQNYTATDIGSQVKFKIKNVGLNVSGSFTGVKGSIVFNPADITGASFAVSVSAASVNTNNASRDKHLKKQDYFDVTNYPKLTFVSSKVTGSAGAYTVEGTLTIKGVSKKISFPFSAIANANGYSFAGQFKINRRNFNVGGSSWVLADELTVTLNISAIK